MHSFLPPLFLLAQYPTDYGRYYLIETILCDQKFKSLLLLPCAFTVPRDLEYTMALRSFERRLFQRCWF